MKLRSIVFSVVLLLSFGINAQTELECKTKLSIFHEAVKAKKYDAAYEPWLYVKDNCPDLNLAIYSDGEKILKHKIENSKNEIQLRFVNALLDLWILRGEHFKGDTPQGEFEAKACQLQYDHKEELGKTTSELFECFNAAFNADKETFTHPKGLYTYFSLMVELFDSGKKSSAELFDTFDDVSEKIDVEIQNYSEKLNALVEKIDNGGTLTNSEENKKRAYESYLKNYTLIQNNMNVIVDKRATCKNLIPLYTKDFEVYQNDSIWLKRSVSRMYHKDCTDDDLYEKLVKQYDKVAPSADTKVYIATLLFKKGKDKEALQYLEKAGELETRSFKKANIMFRIGTILKDKQQYSKARNYLSEALKLNPSNGKPHLLIALMYHDSAKDKNCGKDNFEQRAIFWLAAEEAQKASRVDPTLNDLVQKYVDSYLAKAPAKEKIFLSGLAGKTLKIGCWINRSVKVPTID
ncbi:tetratricopeptide repeat protein [Winogradskyella algicola]|uniref:tetratricopeptide repeat protein n=1 Tax=Winogradskyella algicola TaxID=2575815 RepID=UPI0011085EE0|nr:tetratricopeptide repeat protein [Winogradskyella algicola]